MPRAQTRHNARHVHRQNGAYPGPLILDAAGNLYGTTSEGGVNTDGTVFEIAAGTHTLTTLATFNGANGQNPATALTLDAAGNLYGTTIRGGANNDGTVFEIAAGTNTITTLFTFNGANGINPYSSLLADSAGNLYGTTSGGGPLGGGTVFELSGVGFQTVPAGAPPPPAITLSASPSASNAQPAVLGAVTPGADGDVLTVTLTGDADFAGTSAVTLVDGNILYTPGLVTASKTADPDLIHYTVTDTTTGTATAEMQTVMLSNDPGPTVTPTAAPVASNSTTATLGVATPWFGSDPLSVTLTSDAAFATGSTLTLVGDTIIYTPGLVTSANTGPDSLRYTVTDVVTGAVTTETQTVTLAATTLTTLASFDGVNGEQPEGNLVADAAGNLYGTTSEGGRHGDGSVFEIAAGTRALTTLVSFGGANGSQPVAGLLADAAGNLYGTTATGGANNDGTVFEIAVGTHALTTLATFDGTNGAAPEAALVADAAAICMARPPRAAPTAMARCSRLLLGPASLRRSHLSAATTGQPPMPAWWSMRPAIYTAPPPRAAFSATARCSRSQPAPTPSPRSSRSTAATAWSPMPA